MFKKILVCLDGCDLAEQILPYVKEQAKAFKSTVVFVHVTPEPMLEAPGIPGEPGYALQTKSMLLEMGKEMVSADKYLDRLALSFNKSGIRTKYEILEGMPGESIVNYARANKISLIALVTHGRSGLGRIILGSTADFVIRESGLPILIVRPKTESSGKCEV
jgi:nucleotide-binding universal stress UspA family protein